VACLPRNDLPSRVLAEEQRIDKEVDHAFPHGAAASQATPRFIAPATLIDHRPAVVEERSRLSD